MSDNGSDAFALQDALKTRARAGNGVVDFGRKETTPRSLAVVIGVSPFERALPSGFRSPGQGLDADESLSKAADAKSSRRSAREEVSKMTIHPCPAVVPLLATTKNR